MKGANPALLVVVMMSCLCGQGSASWQRCGTTTAQKSLYVNYTDPVEQQYNVGCSTLNTINKESGCLKNKKFVCSNNFPKFVWQIPKAEFKACEAFFIDYCQDRSKPIDFGDAAKESQTLLLAGHK